MVKYKGEAQGFKIVRAWLARGQVDTIEMLSIPIPGTGIGASAGEFWKLTAGGGAAGGIPYGTNPEDWAEVACDVKLCPVPRKGC
mmetsp:Transcript_19958/g.34093  ORF Transcript_19958/g.34093 Transcript_19958/m.34093 type:complete len:85 (+) Transcript_19958:1478-1732(+)